MSVSQRYQIEFLGTDARYEASAKYEGILHTYRKHGSAVCSTLHNHVKVICRIGKELGIQRRGSDYGILVEPFRIGRINMPTTRSPGQADILYQLRPDRGGVNRDLASGTLCQTNIHNVGPSSGRSWTHEVTLRNATSDTEATFLNSLLSQRSQRSRRIHEAQSGGIAARRAQRHCPILRLTGAVHGLEVRELISRSLPTAKASSFLWFFKGVFLTSASISFLFHSGQRSVSRLAASSCSLSLLAAIGPTPYDILSFARSRAP